MPTRLLNSAPFNTYLCTKHQTQTRNNIQKLLARGSKFPGIKSPKSKWVEFGWIAIAKEAMKTKGDYTGLHRTPQAESLGILANTNWTKLLLVGRASSIMTDSVKCVLHIWWEVKQDTFVNYVLFCCTQGLGLRNISQWEPPDCLHAAASALGLGVTSIYSNCK
jgi:hypothetical protein